MPNGTLCKIEGCGKPVHSWGWCANHYSRWKGHGDPLGGRTPNGEPERYLNDVVIGYEGDDCLLWPYARTKGGYANIKLKEDTSNRYVHDIVCETDKGPKPTLDHEVAHSCGNGHLGCVTKKHIRWATHPENVEEIKQHKRLKKGRWAQPPLLCS